MVSGSLDGTARVWNVETGACLHTEHDWHHNNVMRLRMLLGEEAAASGNEQEECKVRCGKFCIMHGSADDNSVLATLECFGEQWDSEVSRRAISICNGKHSIFRTCFVKTCFSFV